ncbi:MAG: hypothetical protein DMF37_07500 [Verrucomicrobia bacterium]|nr:MAG: hypothetical protein DMF37_07500 [Verrucomicrobiota bacterium]
MSIPHIAKWKRSTVKKIDVDEGSCALLFKEKGKTTCLLVFPIWRFFGGEPGRRVYPRGSHFLSTSWRLARS